MKRSITTLAACAFLVSSPSSQAFKLITDEEAHLPAASGALTTRGITRGPGVKVVSPDLAAGPVKGPFTLKVAFEARGGAKVDPASIKLTYLKATPVDLLDRIKSGVSEGGIEIAGAEVPPGEHQIQVSLQDTEGRKTSKIINLNATK